MESINILAMYDVLQYASTIWSCVRLGSEEKPLLTCLSSWYDLAPDANGLARNHRDSHVLCQIVKVKATKQKVRDTLLRFKSYVNEYSSIIDKKAKVIVYLLLGFNAGILDCLATNHLTNQK